jgi:Protein of unknown function (DUF3830)
MERHGRPNWVVLPKNRRRVAFRTRDRKCQDRGVSRIRIATGALTFEARLETELAPKTCAKFATMLPLKSRIIQARWSGEAAWIPFGDIYLGLDYENHTSYPAPGQLLLYPGGISETEILFPYGGTVFGSKMGQLAGNHFATIEDGVEHLAALGKLVLWEGAQDIVFEAV